MLQNAKTQHLFTMKTTFCWYFYCPVVRAGRNTNKYTLQFCHTSPFQTLTSLFSIHLDCAASCSPSHTYTHNTDVCNVKRPARVGQDDFVMPKRERKDGCITCQFKCNQSLGSNKLTVCQRCVPSKSRGWKSSISRKAVVTHRAWFLALKGLIHR